MPRQARGITVTSFNIIFVFFDARNIWGVIFYPSGTMCYTSNLCYIWEHAPPNIVSSQKEHTPCCDRAVIGRQRSSARYWSLAKSLENVVRYQEAFSPRSTHLSYVGDQMICRNLDLLDSFTIIFVERYS